MVRLSVRWEDLQLLNRLRNVDKRIAFAIVNAINETLKVCQRAVRLHVLDTFTIRVPFVLRQAAIIKPFASVSQSRLYGEISVGKPRRLLLSGFEEGALRTPFKGKASVAVPVDARPNKAASIPESLHISELGFKRPKATTALTRRGRRRGTVGRVWEGLRGTYLIPGAGIFQRIGAGISRVLYVFARPFRLRRLLEFEETVRTTALRVFPEEVRRQVAAALAYNRGR